LKTFEGVQACFYDYIPYGSTLEKQGSSAVYQVLEPVKRLTGCQGTAIERWFE
jgi:hypothetical protein